MKVLVTGATGYVGRHLVKELSKTDHKLYTLVRTKSNSENLRKHGLEIITGDLTDKNSLEQINVEFDAIVHLAFSLFPESNPRINITGFDNILSFARQQPIKKFIYISSQLVYGNTSIFEVIDETHPCNTAMVFANQQLRAESILKKLAVSEGFPFVILRPSEIFGGEGGFFKKVLLDGYINGKTPVVGKGNNAISFTYIGDLVQAIVKSIDKSEIEGEVFNINTPGVLSMNDLVQLIKNKVKTKPIFRVPVFLGWIVASFAIVIAKLTGKVPYMDYDIMRLATMQSGERSIAKAERMIDFVPKYSNIISGLTESYFMNKIAE